MNPSSVMISNLCGMASAFVPLPKALYPERKGVQGGLGTQRCPTPWKSGFVWISPLRRRQAVSCIAPNLPPATHGLTLIFWDEPTIPTILGGVGGGGASIQCVVLLPSSSLTAAVGLPTPLGGLGSGTGGCSAVTHVGSALFMSSLLTELSSCAAFGGREKRRVSLNSGL